MTSADRLDRIVELEAMRETMLALSKRAEQLGFHDNALWFAQSEMAMRIEVRFHRIYLQNVIRMALDKPTPRG